MSDVQPIVRRAAEECETRHRVALHGAIASQVAGKLNGVHEIVDDPNASVDVAFVDVRALGPSGQVHLNKTLPNAAYVVGVCNAEVDDLRSLFSEKQGAPIRIERLICAAAVIDFTEKGLVLREVKKDLSGRDIRNAIDLPIWASHDLKTLT